MAKKQTRRSISLSRDLYFEVMDFAGRSGISMSQIATFGLRAVMDGVVPVDDSGPERTKSLSLKQKRMTLERAISYRQANGLDVGRLSAELDTLQVKSRESEEPAPGLDVSESDRLRFEHRQMAAIANIEKGTKHAATITVSDRLREDIEVAAGRADVGTSDILDRAVNGMLDYLGAAVWCRACLETLGDCGCKHPKTQVLR